METIHNGPKSAAKAIRGELKIKFPGIKFSVRSDSNAINVSWVDGPTEKAVAAVTGKYRLGDFDGMTDSYNYDGTHVVCEDGTIAALGGAHYVFNNRRISDAARAACIAAAATYYQGWETDLAWEQDTLVFRLLLDADLTKGFSGRIEYSEKLGRSTFA